MIAAQLFHIPRDEHRATMLAALPPAPVKRQLRGSAMLNFPNCYHKTIGCRGSADPIDGVHFLSGRQD
jgi:hypothetical protein